MSNDKKQPVTPNTSSCSQMQRYSLKIINKPKLI